MGFNQGYFFPTVITNITSLNGGVDGTVKATDVYPAVDVTDVSQSPNGTTKPYEVVQLLNFVLANLGSYVYQAVLAASPSNLSATYSNGASGVGATLTNSGTQAAFSLDGQAGVVGGRYLIRNQSSAAQNGIYTILTSANLGSATTNWVLTRVVDFNSPSNIINNGLVYVLYGITYAGQIQQDTFTGTMVVGTTAINYAQWSFPIPFPAGRSIVWDDLASASVTAAVNTGYIISNASISTVTLPVSCAEGSVFGVAGKGAGGWILQMGAGQTCHFGSSATSSGGSLSSTNQWDAVQVVCLTANTTFSVLSAQGNITFS